MKSLIFFLLALISCQISFCQSALADSARLSTFIIIYQPGPLWDSLEQPMQHPAFEAHGKYLGELRLAGRIPAGGRYDNKGMIFLLANSLPEADSIRSLDPAVRSHLFDATCFPFYPFYEGCIREEY